jgi:DNA polymerase-3 subunit alpha
MNHKGYQNLMQLSTTANLDGFYYYPRVDHELLEKYNEGIIALSACMGGEVGDALKTDQYDKAVEIATWYKSVFGDRYYLEIQDHGHPDNPLHSPEQLVVNEQVMKLSKQLDIPMVVTCDAHYLKHEDQDAHEILLCVGTGSFLSDEKRLSLKDYPLHVEAPDEIIKRWGTDHPEVITNTKAIADRCNLELELGKILIPKFPVPEGEDEKSYLDKLTYQGLAWRYGRRPSDPSVEALAKTEASAKDGSKITEAEAAKLSVEEAEKTLPKSIAERAAFELKVIDNMGFNGYFLIIQDFINWGKDNGIVFGPGRGSAAGSIISYALKITELDPMQYDLLFERFLNPDRISMPDVDIDIQDTRRGEVIQYCVEKYGTERVANIVTFGRMFARNAVRDVSRVLQVPYAEADRLAKMIPQPVQGRHIPLADSLKNDPDLKREYETNETSKQVLDQAVRLEGTVRSHGVHAAGVVIAPDDIVKFVPLEMAQKGVVSTQYPMSPVEELGLLKMDFLGLSNLTIIKNALRIIKRVYDTDIDINTIPLDDEKTYELFQKGDTTGVFQLESAGMKRYLKDLRPTVFEDIVAMVALYRPGPMQFIDSFIKRKHGQETISYLHSGLENSLKSTYGILVYQEQFMQISKEWCGFTGGQADTLRKAVGKKKIDLMRKVKVDFVEGAVKHGGATQDLAEKFWDQLEEFANYCFNKSHAACYGLIAYQTAYLKAHYPSAFMAALMSSDYDDIDRLAIEITECKHMGIEVLPPDINESYVEFAVVPKTGQVRFGMAAIKNVGTGAVEEILRVRDSEGQFETLQDFFRKVNTRIVNRKALESLVKAGAFDRYGERSFLLHNIDVLLAFGSRIQKEQASGQTDLFGNAIEDDSVTIKVELTLDKPPAIFSQHEQLVWERELLGLYLSQHPLQMFETFLGEHTVPLGTLTAAHDNRAVTIGGAIQDFREITTKNGKKMAFVKIEDLSHEIELILFPSMYQQTLGIWERDRVVLVRGKVNARDRDGNPTDDLKILVDDAREITPDQASAYQATGRKPKGPAKGKKILSTSVKPKPATTTTAPPRVYIRIEKSDDHQTLTTLRQTIDAHQGDTEVVLVVGPPATKQVIRLPMKVSASDDSLSVFGELVGRENVKFH